MKTKYCLVVGVAAVLGLGSCNDFLTIYPSDKTIGPDFWKSKSDVQAMTIGAYTAMLDGAILERAIMWGAFRSDEVVKHEDYVNSQWDNINSVNLLPTQSICGWAQFYNVINRCNIVLNHAPAVMDIDPEYTIGENQVVRGQMLALRSLCYFYLVRAFRDVPYSDQAFESDDANLRFGQSTPGEVLQHCIDDLHEAEGIIMNSGAYGETDWRNVGFFTLNAVYALLADIYLWRGAMTKNKADYEQVVLYADKIIASKDAFYKKYNRDQVTIQDPTDVFHLYAWDGIRRDGTPLSEIFSVGNSRESILEWQYDGNNNANGTLKNYYDRQGDGVGDMNPRLVASKIFRNTDANANLATSDYVFLNQNDYRYWNYVYGAGPESENKWFFIRKMVESSQETEVFDGTEQTARRAKSNPIRANYKQNWIVYRLADVMLMKAEALVELAGDDEDLPHLEAAFSLVQRINKRSLMSKAATDTLVFDNYKSKERMELLVMAERERELCFEGKRWFDLLRFNYRHTEGVDISKRMGDADYEAPALYAPLLNFLVRKYESSGDAVKFKMKTEPYLYWPILDSETRVNENLVQNPVFILEESTKKNY